MNRHYDALETRDPALREREQLARLAQQVVFAKSRAPAYAERLAGVDAADVRTRVALAALPVTRKSELLALQLQQPPFGGFAAVGWGGALRVFASPGPIY